MKIGFIILAHEEPDAVMELVAHLADSGQRMVVHYDAKSPSNERQFIHELEKLYPGQVHVLSEVKCAWGEWSLVEAVLRALGKFQSMPEKPDFIHLMSAADCPTRPISDLEVFLSRYPDQDYIEAHDITKKCWVKGGLSMERFQFYFPANYRTNRKAFNFWVYLQRRLGMKRKIPCAMVPHMGSQWWTLRWGTCEAVIHYIERNPELIRYFKSTWIPDESFFQTLVRHLVPESQIANLQLLFHHFTKAGRPFEFGPEHVGAIRKIPHFFIRKVKASARACLLETITDRKRHIPRPEILAKVHRMLDQKMESKCDVMTP